MSARYTSGGLSMTDTSLLDLDTFRFRDLDPKIYLGTASDRYAGWLGQIYTKERYQGRITRRNHTVGGKSFTEEVLPVGSVEEYFEHFSVLEIDHTFYRPLLETEGKPTQNYHVLRKYRQYMSKNDHLILKVPQMITAQKLRRGSDYLPLRVAAIILWNAFSHRNPDDNAYISFHSRTSRYHFSQAWG